MSEPLNNNPIQHYKRTPKKFLKKGEGLKRFAAYKPPLPKATKKPRQAVVTFNLNENKYAESKLSYLPDILFDDSVNLSMEVPKIGPPKICHTPIRPPPKSRLNINNQQTSKTCNQNNTKQTKKNDRRYNLRKRGQIEAIVQRHMTPPQSPDVASISPSPPPPSRTASHQAPEIAESQINGSIDNLMKKIKQKKTVLDQENIASGTNATTTATTINNNYKPNNNSSFNENEDFCTTPVNTERCQTSRRSPEIDLSRPLPGNCILAMGKQIQLIQSTVNELREKIKNCTCGMEPAKQPVARVTRRTQSKTTTAAKSTTRPSASADNNSTPKILSSLMEEVAQLKEKIEELQLRE